jgi:DNA-binding transcriptional ArsR family regulator
LTGGYSPSEHGNHIAGFVTFAIDEMLGMPKFRLRRGEQSTASWLNHRRWTPHNPTCPGRTPNRPPPSCAPGRTRSRCWPARSYDVGTLANQVGISIATVSQHLSKLRLAGVITVRREGRRHLYSVEDPHVVTLIQQIFDHIGPDGTLAPDPPAAPR